LTWLFIGNNKTIIKTRYDMNLKNLCCISLSAVALLFSCTSKINAQDKILLKDNWAIQSSVEVKADGKAISMADFKLGKWYPATMPSTVLAALVENKVYPDPYFGTNIETLPGYSARRGANMPGDSPFRVAWWYRTVFSLPQNFKGMNTWLRFHSINYKANIWLNGHLIADTTSIAGAYRLYNLNVTEFAIPGNENCLALQIFPPRGTDLTITWVDWNPTPPDRGMGIWYDVSVQSTGPVAIEHPYVKTKLNLPSTDKARLTISAELVNTTDKSINGVLKGKIENITFSTKVKLSPKETKKIVMDPDKFSQLEINNPRLWWPHTVGKPNLYDLSLKFETRGKVSDSLRMHFGIREITSWMNNFRRKPTRVYQVNGQNIVIKGGGYVEDMMLRPSKERIDTDIQYAKHMGLNALRMEAPRGSDYIFDKCDEEGILLMVGWCCCSSWEEWKRWTPDVESIAQKSWADQLLRLRNHPSVFTWLYGSDNHPTENVEKMYLQVLNDIDDSRPHLSSATNDSSTVTGNTGVWMGPYPLVYAYSPPVYWYGKLEYNTEAGPAGEQIPPVETMRLMMPEKDLWPMSHSWDIRLHKAFYPAAREALYSRYGKPSGLEEYSMKSQVLQYEATRAMYEAFQGNKYKSSGIIYWMYNSAWPSMYWQFYDYFFAPNGSFYGTRKACENLHIQYSYDDNSIRIVNSNYKDFSGLQATAKLYNFDLKEILSKEAAVDIKSDESKKVIMLDAPKDPVSFLKLMLYDNTGKEISSNFYWLSGNGDEKADFTSLNSLPEVELNYHVSELEAKNDKYSLTVEIENPTASLAFFVNPKILKKSSRQMVLPIFWDDNYFSLLPQEKKQVKVEFSSKDLGGEPPLLVIDGWNIKHAEF
jgi:exo-1,4-beta-D-glucosaminidase